MSQNSYDYVVLNKGRKRLATVGPSNVDLDRLADAAVMAWQDDIEFDTKIKVRASFIFSGRRTKLGVRILVQQMDGARHRMEMTGLTGSVVVEAMIKALDMESGARHDLNGEEATALRIWITRKQEENAAPRTLA